MKNKMERNFFTAEEVSEFLAIPLNTIYRLTRRGKLKGIKIGKQWRYLKTDIEEISNSGMSPRALPDRKVGGFIERRDYSRLNCNIACNYSINIPSLKTFQSDTAVIRNLSAGGVLIKEMPEKILQIEADDPVQLEFELFNENGVKKINTKGKVVRLAENISGIFGFGIRFRNIEREYQNEITNYIG